MFRLSDAKPDADVAYLTSAITRDALTTKFRELFGRDPVAVDKDEPLVVKEAKVPEIILSGIDPDIIPVLQSCAVEHSDNAEAQLPEIDGSTLLYTIHDDTPAKIALEAVGEYADMADDARDVVVGDAAAQANINIQDGTAYLSKSQSTIEIGIYVINAPFAELFQFKLENSGGQTLEQDKQVQVFDELFNELPGGESPKESTVRSQLMAVVGLADALPAGQKPVAENMKAPGPGGQAATPETAGA